MCTHEKPKLSNGYVRKSCYSCKPIRASKRLMLKRCANCEHQFKATTATALYCGKSCKAKAKDLRQTSRGRGRTCNICGVMFKAFNGVMRCDDCVTKVAVAVKDLRAERALRKAVSICASEVRALHRIKGSAGRYVALRSQSCMDCSAPIKYVHGMGLEAKLCDKCKVAKKRASRRIHKARRRARIRGAQSERIDPFDVFDRDKWRCHLCGIKTLKSLRGTHEDRAPELEHIMPLSLGGTHTWDNVACSCRKCNNEKGTTVLGQLGLIL